MSLQYNQSYQKKLRNGQEVVKEGVEKIHDSVTYWISTPKRKEKFEERTKQLRVPYTKNLALDVQLGRTQLRKCLKLSQDMMMYFVD